MKNKQSKKLNDIMVWIIDHKVKTFLIIILVFFIPIVFVHILFKIDCGKEWLQPEWSAGDIITYIAGFEACVSTAALSFLALWQNQKHKEQNDKMERRLIEIENEKIRLSNLPQFFVWSSQYDVVIDKNYQKSIPAKHFVLKRDVNIFKITKTDMFWNSEDDLPFVNETWKNGIFSITNCGNNTAHKIQLKIFAEGYEVANKNITSLKKDDVMYLQVSIDPELDFKSTLKLSISYMDSFFNFYEQSYYIFTSQSQMSTNHCSGPKITKHNENITFHLDETKKEENK